MSQLMSLFLPGNPVPKARARVAKGHAYTPATTKAYETAVKLGFKVAMAREGWQPIIGPVWINLLFTLPVPASWNKTKRHDALSGRIAPTSKPDLTNLAKACEDALNGIAYADDSAIVHLQVSKRYGREPGVTIQVGAWEYVEAVKAGVKP